jgi:glutamate/tyrosine decarboxylase-like PLP-dependent enzyme
LDASIDEIKAKRFGKNLETFSGRSQEAVLADLKRFVKED